MLAVVGSHTCLLQHRRGSGSGARNHLHRRILASYLELLTLKDLIEQQKFDKISEKESKLASTEADERAARAALAKAESALRAPVTLPGVLAVLRYREEIARDGYDLFDDTGPQTLLDSIHWCLERELGA
jgi:hypothetical protein